LPISGVVAFEVVKAAAASDTQQALVTRTLATLTGPTKPMPVANDKDGGLRGARKVTG
jgi:hypothetical protein